MFGKVKFLVVQFFSPPGQSPGRAIVLPPASASVLAETLAKCCKVFTFKFYVMGKALSGKLSCPCDRSCLAQNYLLSDGDFFQVFSFVCEYL